MSKRIQEDSIEYDLQYYRRKCEELQAEVERLRNTSKQCWYPIACEYVSELEQERDQLKEQLFKYGCEDIDVIRCLKTLAYEHNLSDVPRYKDLAKRTMDKYVERCTLVHQLCFGSALAAHRKGGLTDGE